MQNVGKRRKRKLVDVVNSTGVPAQQQPENEFERERAERIKRNDELLENLGVRKAVSSLQKGQGSSRTKSPRRRRALEAMQKKTNQVLTPTRRSARIQGVPVDIEAVALAEDFEEVDDHHDHADENKSAMTQEEYFAFIGKEVKPLMVSDSHFKGWVNPEICRRYGIEDNASDAWDKNGGGKFSRKIDKKAIPNELRAKGWSYARAHSATQLRKNPNAYFYRHVAPHLQQAHGEWTQEEHDLFLETAKSYGGLVFDRRFKITRSGKAIFVG